MKLQGRTAIVTGAGKGPGRWHALALSGWGAGILVNDLNGACAKHITAEIRAKGRDATAAPAAGISRRRAPI
jgi:NAD(P)-dependent dehydrogenase (short-subunit alcohol dehydrogenase family)